MESAAVLRSFNCTVLNLRSSLEKPCAFAVRSNATWSTTSKCSVQGFSVGRTILSPAKAATSASATKSDDMSALEKNSQQSATFPSGFETLILGVCDETQIAELKIKVGDFQMHLKRNIEAPIPISYPVTPSPVPSKPVVESSAAAPASSPPKTSPGKVNPFTNVPVEKSRKLAALEASGASGYVLVASPTVGSFRKGRTLKGKKQPSSCKEGDLIKEGQVIGFLDQFGTELPVKSDVAGEVLKLLFDDGEAVGYGDPLIAVLPSFHGIE